MSGQDIPAVYPPLILKNRMQALSPVQFGQQDPLIDLTLLLPQCTTHSSDRGELSSLFGFTKKAALLVIYQQLISYWELVASKIRLSERWHQQSKKLPKQEITQARIYLRKQEITEARFCLIQAKACESNQKTVPCEGLPQPGVSNGLRRVGCRLDDLRKKMSDMMNKNWHDRSGYYCESNQTVAFSTMELSKQKVRHKCV